MWSQWYEKYAGRVSSKGYFGENVRIKFSNAMGGDHIIGSSTNVARPYRLVGLKVEAEV